MARLVIMRDGVSEYLAEVPRIFQNGPKVPAVRPFRPHHRKLPVGNIPTGCGSISSVFGDKP